MTSLSCRLWTFFAFSGLDEETAHHGNREEAARQLCFYRKYREEGHHNVPEETKEVLQNRIDPNYGERERKTVHALLYTPGGEYLMEQLNIWYSVQFFFILKGYIHYRNSSTFIISYRFWNRILCWNIRILVNEFNTGNFVKKAEPFSLGSKILVYKIMCLLY